MVIALLTPREMAEADRLATAAGVPELTLMEHAGAAVAAAVVQLNEAPGSVAVVAGSGNNGGDGYVCARLLAGQGFDVHMLTLTGARPKGAGAAAIMASRWSGPVREATAAALAECDVIVDALFGAGLDRPVTGAAAALIDAMNETGKPILAVDLPSGIQGATGCVIGTAVQAVRTVTFFRPKPAHLLLPGRSYCGETSVADIGIPDSVLGQIRPLTSRNDPDLWGAHFPWPRLDGHKYDRGHAAVLSGAMPMTGAARLSARAALRAGAGLVTLLSPRDALTVNAVASLAVMVRAVDGARELGTFLDDPRVNVVTLGPGGGIGRAMRAAVTAALARPCAVVLDADALTSFAEDAGSLFEAVKARGQAAVVMTPHEGEFNRIFKSLDDNPKLLSKLEKARAAAAESGAVIVLKGADTVVAAPDGRAAISDNAPSWLATAGAGDVLTGIVTGLLAQTMPTFEAACAAVWLHGEAGQAIGPGLISEDLSEALPQVYGRLYVRLHNDSKELAGRDSLSGGSRSLD